MWLLCLSSATLASAQSADDRQHVRAEAASPVQSRQVRFAQPSRAGQLQPIDAPANRLAAQPVSQRSDPSTSSGYHALTLDSAAHALASHDAQRSPQTTDPPATSDPVINSEESAATNGPAQTRTPLPPRGSDAATKLKSRGDTAARRSPSAALPSLVTVASSLAIVLGLFFVVIVVLRRGSPKGLQLLPRDALEVLGRAPLPGKQQVYLIRCGGKLLLVNISSGGAETLTEITDPREIERLVALCQQWRPDSASNTFRQALSELGEQPHAPGFVEQAPAPERRGLFAGRGREASHVA